MSFRPALMILAMATTAACGAQNTSRKPLVADPTPAIRPAPRIPVAQTPVRPEFTTSDFSAAMAEDDRARRLAETPSSVIPYGRATFDGHVRSGAEINGDGGYDIIGDLALGVDINSRGTVAGRNLVTGSITDLTVIDRETDDQLIPLDGSLTIRGDSVSGEIEATATGVLGRDRTDEAAWAIDLDGSFRDDFDRADTVTGTAKGGTIGGRGNDYDVELTGDGRFYGLER